MADVIETPLRLIAELTTDGTLAGRYQLEFQRRIEVDGKEVVPPAHMTRELTAEEGAAILNSNAAQLAGQVQALNAQIASERITAAEAVKAADVAATARVVAAFRQADAAWDEQVSGILNSQETIQ